MPKGIPTSGVNKGWFKKGVGFWTGKKRPNMQSENHFAWKGNKAQEVPKHTWVVRRLGKPDTCENCGKSGLSGKKIHWASISHKHKRVLSDWIRLCVPCHKNYDLGNLKLKQQNHVHK